MPVTAAKLTSKLKIDFVDVIVLSSRLQSLSVWIDGSDLFLIPETKLTMVNINLKKPINRSVFRNLFVALINTRADDE